MTDIESGPVPSAVPAEPELPAAPPRRRGGGAALLWLLVLAALAGGGYWLWQQQQVAERARGSADQWRGVAEALQSQADLLAGEVAQLRERQRSIEQRLGDLTGGNRVLREEVLGIGERAALLEDALARLAQSRREGAATLQLDEIEFLLQLAAERLQLFGDRAAAERALQLAAGSLDSLNDPLYAGLRQTLAQELALLQNLPADPTPALRGELVALQRAMPTLPQLGVDSGEAPTDAPSRLREMLATLVTVRRVDDAGAALSPLERSARLSALGLDLTLARAALERHDGEAWRTALDAALGRFDRLFEPDLAATRQARQRLQGLQGTEIGTPPPSLGAALQELRNLRATRRIGQAPADDSGAPTPAEPAPEPDPIDLERR